MSDVSRQEVNYLIGLYEDGLPEILREVFARKVSERSEFGTREHYFLGLASHNAKSSPEWQTRAVCYFNPDNYPPEWGDPEPGWHWLQTGECGICSTPLVHQTRYCICPVCGSTYVQLD